ncbi:MAG: nucleoside triphosphate pyrophosphatase [Armatimonadota bacterium]
MSTQGAQEEARPWDAALSSALRRPLVLASASPRRAMLLRQAGIEFEVRVPQIVEDADESGLPPAEVALTHARTKAQAVARELWGRLVLGADTVVVLGTQVLGKPDGPAQARAMLQALSGRVHEVITAVALAVGDGGGIVAEQIERTRVRFRRLSEGEIECYVASGEPLDKAGAYGIQGRGALLVREIEGCYFNVVGLPLSRIWDMLSSLGHGAACPAGSGAEEEE